MRKKKSRALRADGAKIRNLRDKTRKTQKELLRGSTVGMRTYQRAEQGLLISPAVLREIAGLFNVNLGTIVRDPTEPRGETVRLYPCDGRGGLKILNELQLSNATLSFNFDVDPYGEAAAQIADVIRFCEMSEYSQGRLDRAEFIEAVGVLNGKIAQLYSVGVNIHFASYHVWEGISQDVLDQIIRIPMIQKRHRFIFSEQSGILQRMMPPWQTYEEVCKHCHVGNFNRGIQPEQLRRFLEERDGPFADDDFIVAYEAYYDSMLPNVENDRGGADAPPLRLIEDLQN